MQRNIFANLAKYVTVLHIKLKIGHVKLSICKSVLNYSVVSTCASHYDFALEFPLAYVTLIYLSEVFRVGTLFIIVVSARQGLQKIVYGI